MLVGAARRGLEFVDVAPERLVRAEAEAIKTLRNAGYALALRRLP